MLEQTKNRRDELLACGLKRHEFRLRCKADKNGEYSNPVQIILLCSHERAYALREKLAHYFCVNIHRIDENVRYVSILEPHTEWDRGFLYTWKKGVHYYDAQ